MDNPDSFSNGTVVQVEPYTVDIGSRAGAANQDSDYVFTGNIVPVNISAGVSNTVNKIFFNFY